MAAIRLGLIRRYLRPYKRTVLIGALALVVVNLLSVSIPLLVRAFHELVDFANTFPEQEQPAQKEHQISA